MVLSPTERPDILQSLTSQSSIRHVSERTMYTQMLATSSFEKEMSFSRESSGVGWGRRDVQGTDTHRGQSPTLLLVF